MAMRIGQGSTVQAGFDTAWGTAGSPSFNISHKSESLKYVADKKEEESLVGGRASRGVQTLGSKVEGDLSFILKPDEIAAIIAWATGKEASTTQIDTSAAYRHTFEPLEDPAGSAPKASVVIDRKAGVYQYSSCKVDSLKISGSPNGFLEGSVTLRGYDEADGVLNGSVKKSSLKAFRFVDASITVDGSDFGDYVQSFSYEYSNSLESDLYVMSSGTKMGEIEFGKLGVSGSLELLYDTETANLHKNKFKTDSNINIEIKAISTEEVDTGQPYELVIKIPVSQITDSSFNISGADRIKHTINFQGLEDDSNKVTTIEVVDGTDSAYI